MSALLPTSDNSRRYQNMFGSASNAKGVYIIIRVHDDMSCLFRC